MYDIKWIRDNAEAFDRGRARRGLAPLSAELIEKDDLRKAPSRRCRRRRSGAMRPRKRSAPAMQAKDTARAEALKAEVAQIKANWPQLEQAERDAKAALDTALSEIPNTPLDEVPTARMSTTMSRCCAGATPSRTRAPRRWAIPRARTFRHWRAAEADGFRDGVQTFGRAFRRQQGRAGAARAGARAIHARSAHGSARYTEVAPPLLWCATTPCSARRNCRSSARISSRPAISPLLRRR